jgi:membrane-bound lytic murein transglycosylase B
MAQIINRTSFLAPAVVLLAAAMVLVSCETTPEGSQQQRYQPPYQQYSQTYQPLSAWVQQVEQEAIADQVSPVTVHQALDNFMPNPRVAQLDQKQPEGTISFAAYKANTITPDRIAKGADLMHRYADFLSGIEVRTGVPPQIVVALWGIESSYGANMGSFEVVNSLATLAYVGRRAPFFRSELMAALHVIDQEHMDVSQLRGSWAGAMGQCQFMPSTYLRYAVDGDGDGRRDIWSDPVDVLASIANYLQAEGWHRDTPWAREVITSGSSIDPSEVGLTQARTIEEWSEMGVVGTDGMPLSQPGVQASLLQPDGAGGASFLAFDNVRALMRWNHSTYFAVSVGLLADEIKHY